MIIKFVVAARWIGGRLKELAQNVFGSSPLQIQHKWTIYSPGARFLILGSQERIAQALADPGLAAYVAPNSNIQTHTAALTTDDWPDFSQHEPGIPAALIIISPALIFFCSAFTPSPA